MKLKKHGDSTSIIEGSNIDGSGFWIFDGSQEHYLSFSDFPWFADATIKAITHIEKASDDHFFWPDLDVDLTLNMIRNPETYPLKCK